MSSVPAEGSHAASGARDAQVKWEGLAELAAYSSMGKSFVSRGHFVGRWRAVVSANAAAAPVYTSLSRSSRFPTGAALAKKHTELSTGAPGPLFVMVKRDAGFFPQGGDWEYVVTDPDGWIEDRGPIASCARCHAEATADWVFGLPVDARDAGP
jgi:hypothetical protein